MVAVLGILAAVSSLVAIIAAIVQRRAANAIRADMSKQKIIDDPGTGLIELDGELLDSVLSRLTLNQRPSLIVIVSGLAGIGFGVAAAVVSL